MHPHTEVRQVLHIYETTFELYLNEPQTWRPTPLLNTY